MLCDATVCFLCGLARGQSEYTMLDGTTYPRGTSFAVLFRYMFTREAYFTRAKEFIPERQAQTYTSHTPKLESSNNYSDIPITTAPTFPLRCT